MKAVIFAGGLGTRLSEETHLKPKPMIEIGGKPIIWHIMKIYSAHGINEFIICLGYKGYAFKEFFNNYYLHSSNVTFDFSNNHICHHEQRAEPWKVTLVDTGVETMTGGRLKRVRPYLDDDDFCLTYGDGVADVNITELIEYHKKHNKLATMTAVQPPGRYGNLMFDGSLVDSFKEKPRGDGGWINGGFFVVNPKVIDFVIDDSTIWEQEPLDALTKNKELMAYKHKGFWQCMDTVRDKIKLEEYWQANAAPWKVW